VPAAPGPPVRCDRHFPDASSLELVVCVIDGEGV
jgi:hypothetical protein